MRVSLVAMITGILSPLVAATPPTKDLKALAFAKRPAQARALFESSLPAGAALDAAWLEAMSWVGRAGAIGEDWNLAAEYSERTLQESERLLQTRALDSDPEAPLPIALGAAIETLGKFYVARNDPGQAVAFLRSHLGKYAGTSIETRLNKNLLLLDLEGKPMPEFETAEWLNGQRFASADLDDHVTLFFFWAHWCSDCRAQKPVVHRLLEQFRDRGLRVVAPTRNYGYIKRGKRVGPAEERAHILDTQVSKDPLLQRVPVPLSEPAFVSFGVSSTPTLVLVDRDGVVRLYHPGEMDEADLASRIESLL